MKMLRACLVTVFVSMCALSGAFAKEVSTPAIAKDEQAMSTEKRPDFSSPPVLDTSIKVAEVPLALKWYTARTNVWGSARAKQGGTYRSSMEEFPETFRTVGPNANGAMRPAFGGNYPAIITLNYDTKEFMPSLATHWAFGPDGKTVYYKLNEKARWSDGQPITSDDYVFMLKFFRSPNIQDPWYNDYYTSQITDVKAYGKYAISVTWVTSLNQPELLYNTIIAPRPSHFYKGDIPKTYVDDYQWKCEPTTGPYYLSDFVKGESLTFSKVKDWWGYEYNYNKYRFNVDKEVFSVITGGDSIVKEYFYKGQLDIFLMLRPQLWQAESTAEQIAKGYIDRQFAFYVPIQGVSGIFLNTKSAIFSNVKVRQGLYYAINIQKMIDTTLRGEYARYHNIGLGHEFAGVNFDDDTIRKPAFDPDKAAALFSEAGYKTVGGDGIRVNASGKRLSFDLIYQTPDHTDRLAILKEEAKKAGLEITLHLMQQGAFSALLEKKYEAFWGGMSTGLVPDYWEYFHSDNAAKTQTNNFWGYANPEMDKLIEAMRGESDIKKKAEYSRQIQKLVDREALVIPNYYVPFYRGASWKWVRYPAWLTTKYTDNFFEPTIPYLDYGSYFGFMWIDSAIRDEVMATQKAKDTFKSQLFMDTRFKAK